MWTFTHPDPWTTVGHFKSSGRFRWAGKVRIRVIRPGMEDEVWESENQITDDGVDLLVAALRGEDAEINYIAWGDDDTAPAASDTALGNETGRKLITSQAAGDPGETVTVAYLAPQDANGQIEEVGWYAQATATPGSGVLLARILYSHEKTDGESIQVDRTDTLGAV